MQNQGDVETVVLAGTSASKTALDRVAEALRAGGKQVELITGLERTFVQLLRVAFRTGASGRYLIFGGADLPAATLDKARKGVEANGVAAAHLWAGEVSWADEAAAIREVAHRLASVGVDLPPPACAATPPTPPPPPSSRFSPPPTSPVPLRSPAVTMRAVPSFAPQPATPPPTPFPVASASTPHGMDATPSGAMAISAPPAAPSADDDDLLRPPAGPFGRMWRSSAGKAFIGFTTVATLGLAVWAMLPAEEAAAESSPVASASAAPESPDTPSVAGADASVTAPSEDVDPPAEAEPSDAEEAPVEEVVEEEAVAPEEDVAIAVPLGEDGELVYAALKKQSIRAVDVLLASPRATKKRGRRTIVAAMRWEEANAYCETLVVDGVTGWRLPDIGEIGWLSRANVISHGTYWTATKGDAFGDQRVVWNVRRKRMTSAGMKWRGGRAICVRFQVQGDGPS